MLTQLKYDFLKLFLLFKEKQKFLNIYNLFYQFMFLLIMFLLIYLLCIRAVSWIYW